MDNKSGIELTFLLSSGESLFIKIDSLKDTLNALFSQLKIEKSNYLYSIGDYIVISWIIEAALT